MVHLLLSIKSFEICLDIDDTVVYNGVMISGLTSSDNIVFKTTNNNNNPLGIAVLGINIQDNDIIDSSITIDSFTTKNGVIAEFVITNRGSGYNNLLNNYAIENGSENFIINSENCNSIPILGNNLINSFDIIYGGHYKITTVKFSSKLNPGSDITSFINRFYKK